MSAVALVALVLALSATLAVFGSDSERAGGGGVRPTRYSLCDRGGLRDRRGAC